MAEEKSERLIVQISTGAEVPYEDTAPGGVLSSFSDNVFGAWTYLTPSGEYESDLLKIQFSDDQLQLNLQVKDSARFNNGRDITAEDIEFSLLRGFFVNPPFFAGFLKCLNGVSERLADPKPGSVAGIHLVDKQTIQLYFNRPCPEFIHTLSLPFFSPRPSEELLGDRINFRKLPVGAGPYSVEAQLENGTVYVLKRVRGGGPREIELRTTSLSQGSIDVTVGNVPTPSAFVREVSDTPNATLTLFTSNTHPMFQEGGIRSLFYSVFDRIPLAIDKAHSAAWDLSTLPRSQALSFSEIEKARSSLVQKLRRKFPNGLDVSIPVLTRSFSLAFVKMLEELQRQFALLNIRVIFFPRPIKFLEGDEAKSYPFWLWGLVIDPLSAATMLSSFHSESAYSFHRVEDLDIKNKFVAAAMAKSKEDRFTAEVELDLKISRGGYGIPLLRSRNYFAYNPVTIESLGSQANLLSLDLSKIKMHRKSKLKD